MVRTVVMMQWLGSILCSVDLRLIPFSSHAEAFKMVEYTQISCVVPISTNTVKDNINGVHDLSKQPLLVPLQQIHNDAGLKLMSCTEVFQEVFNIRESA